MSDLSSSYAKWDAMDVSDDEEQRWQPPRDIDVPLNITDDDLATPQFASPEDAAQEAARVKAMSDGDRANWRAAGWLHSRAGDADEAGECARRSAVHDELESVASERDWQERWSSDGEKRRRIVEARLRRTPAIGAEVRLPPCAGFDFPSALEILWCWGEAVCLFHAAASTALGAAKKPGATTLDDPHWKVKLGGWSRDDALDDLRRDLDDLRGDVAGPDEDWVNADARRRRGVRAKLDPGAGAGAKTWRDWVALCSKRYAPLALHLPSVLSAVFDATDAAIDAVLDKDGALLLSQLSVGLQFLARQLEGVTVALFVDGPETLRRRVDAGDYAASASAFAEMWEATFERGDAPKIVGGDVERWAARVWPWDLEPAKDDGRRRTPRHPDLARFRGNALVAWYPIRVLSDRSPTTLRELAKRSSSFAAFAVARPGERLASDDFAAAEEEDPAPDHLAAVDPRRAAKGDFDVGTHVALCRLSRADLNGQRGVVERRVAGGRCGVRLPGHPKLLAIRAANLIPLAAPVPHPPQKRTPRPGGESTVTVSLPGYAGDPPPDAALVDVPSKSADAFAQEEGP